MKRYKHSSYHFITIYTYILYIYYIKSVVLTISLL